MEARTMAQLTHNWWAIALRGAVAILFGVIAFLMPGPTILALVTLFAAFALVDGVFTLVSAIRRADRGPDWMLVIGGIAGIAVGILGLVSPGTMTIVLLAWIAAWAILTGVAAIVAAYRLREVLQGEWLLALNGVVSVLFGLILIFFPGAGAIAIIWLIAAWAIVSGVILVALALRLRSRGQGSSTFRSGATSA
jgi:uncharacterized membrane protein HdeD (DUF308 family)